MTADALVVSNHGGRQLDGSHIEVWMDGGIRSDQDVLKAWAPWANKA